MLIPTHFLLLLLAATPASAPQVRLQLEDQRALRLVAEGMQQIQQSPVRQALGLQSLWQRPWWLRVNQQLLVLNQRGPLPPGCEPLPEFKDTAVCQQTGEPVRYVSENLWKSTRLVPELIELLLAPTQPVKVMLAPDLVSWARAEQQQQLQMKAWQASTLAQATPYIKMLLSGEALNQQAQQAGLARASAWLAEQVLFQQYKQEGPNPYRNPFQQNDSFTAALQTPLLDQASLDQQPIWQATLEYLLLERFSPGWQQQFSQLNVRQILARLVGYHPQEQTKWQQQLGKELPLAPIIARLNQRFQPQAPDINNLETFMKLPGKLLKLDLPSNRLTIEPGTLVGLSATHWLATNHTLLSMEHPNCQWWMRVPALIEQLPPDRVRVWFHEPTGSPFPSLTLPFQGELNWQVPQIGIICRDTAIQTETTGLLLKPLIE